MVLSDNGDHPMTKLSDTQAVILSAAAQRDDGAVLPLPGTLKLKGGAVDKVLGSLNAKGLIDHQGAPRGDDPPPLRITRAGLQAIGVEPEDEETQPATAATQADAPATTAEAAGAEAQAQAGKPADTRPKVAATRTPRAGTKQALMIEMLRRPEGATVEQIAAATGWQHHTIRGAISGALKKKLGLTVEARRSAPTSVVGAGSQARDTREVGPNKSGAKGSATIYRITGSSPSTS
jgi:hypothetical protein